MLFIVHGVDGPDAKRIRDETRATHLAYLDRHADKVVLAGATQTDDASRPTGSVYIINVAGRAEADAFVADEPFCMAGLFETLTVSRMRRGQWHPESAPETPEGN